MSDFIHRIPHEPWKKPSKNEDQYFHRQELEERAHKARRRQEEEQRKERERLRETHRDHCPDCGTLLVTMSLGDSQAKRCPECRGVWLDREVFQAVVPQEDHEEALSEMFRALMRFSLGGIPDVVWEEEKGEKEQ